MQLTTTISTKGQVVIPKSLRHAFGLKPNDRVQFTKVNKQIVITPVSTVDQMKGFISTKHHRTEEEIEKAIVRSTIKNI